VMTSFFIQAVSSQHVDVGPYKKKRLTYQVPKIIDEVPLIKVE
jgi:hypothetical protein